MSKSSLLNSRFLLSLSVNSRCLVVDDQLTVLPVSASTLNVEPVNKVQNFAGDEELTELKDRLKDTQPVSCLLNLCKTLDQVSLLSVYGICGSVGKRMVMSSSPD